MLLLVGPPVSGKSTRILSLVQDRLKNRDERFRLLVPTATMAEHVRNSLARKGFLFRPDLVLTFSKFIQRFPAEVKPVTDVTLLLIVEELLGRLAIPGFAGVKDLPGFRDALAAALEEFSTAGVDSSRLESLLGEGVLTGTFAPPFVGVFRAVEGELFRRGLAFRERRLRAVSEAVATAPFDDIDSLYLDGFLSFPGPELGVLAALARRIDLTVTLPDWEGAERSRRAFVGMGLPEERLPERAVAPRTVVVAAPTLEQEVEEIARRILASGRPFREIGILVRQTAKYVPALRTALERFGIPSRFYISDPLSSHALIRYFSALVSARRSGWDHELLLTAVRMQFAGIVGTSTGDRLEFKMREGLPDKGLDRLLLLAPGEGRLKALVDALARFDAATTGFATAREQARNLRGLRAAIHPPRVGDGVSPEEALRQRALPAALQAFDAALEETAEALGADSLVDFETFWRQAQTALDVATLRVPDHRHNVVHVLDAWEARQWNLPVMFVCGLLEGQFPAYPPQEPLVPDAVRTRLAAAGIPVKTLAERQTEEDFLWRMARTRASEELVLSYPRFNDVGESNLASFHLTLVEAPRELAAAVRPASRFARRAPGRATIGDERLRARLAELHSKWKPTAVESFLQCPFQFFSRYTLKLRTAPARPEERLDRLAQGTLVHAALAEWHKTGEPMGALFDRLFQAFCVEKRVRQGYASETARLEMLRDLGGFLKDPRLEAGWTVEVEQDFEVELEPGVRVKGRVDRYDVSPDGRVRLYDYKYSSAAGLQKRFQQSEGERYVQGGLYLLALSAKYRVESFHYCGLRGGANWKGWDTADQVRELMEQARQSTLLTAAAVTSGEIRVKPLSTEACAYCDYRDACRVREMPRERAAGAEEE